MGFNATLRMGKITCMDTQRDIAISESELGDFGVGEKVSYMVSADKFGTPMATNLQPADSDSPAKRAKTVATGNGASTIGPSRVANQSDAADRPNAAGVKRPIS